VGWCVAVAFDTASCAYLQAQQQARIAQQQAQAAQQQAEAQALADAYLARSPEGSSDQWELDKATLQTLTPAQTEALNDAKLGLPMTPDEQNAIASMTRDQQRAVVRLAAQEKWSKQQADQMQSMLLQEQAVQSQQAQTRALISATQSQPSTTNCIDTNVGISCTTQPSSGGGISGILRNLGH
jgi:hypothetical protein